MAVDSHAIKLYDALRSDPAFGRGNAICDLGSQVIYGSSNSVRDIMVNTYGFARYVCIDIDGAHGALKLDLNWAKFEDVGEQFAVVTNHGTTEHCLNQYNCFKFMHDLTCVGGLMIHMVPSWPFCNYQDCFFFMSTEVFENIADANDYERVRCEQFDGAIGAYVMAVLRRTSDAEFRVPIQRQYRTNGKIVSEPPCEWGELG